MRLWQTIFPPSTHPIGDLFSGIGRKEPTQFEAIPKAEGALNDGIRASFWVQLAENIFLKKRGQAWWNFYVAFHLIIFFNF